MFKKKYFKWPLRVLLFIFLFANIIAAFHAYKFTHFSKEGVRTERLILTPFKKAALLFTGVDNPRPVNSKIPSRPYKTILINSNVPVECWLIPTDKAAKGTVILFHGYTSNKSSLLWRSETFLQNGYNCLLVDFMGSGGSGGDATTIGFKEAREVKDCYDYLSQSGEKNIFLFGSSMGAAAIMKAMHDYEIHPKKIIIECPFATMYQTVCNRFAMLHVPQLPLAGIMVFWGGLENGFWGFSFNPVDYSRDIHCPVLLQYGEKDDRVNRTEIDEIYKALPGPKKLVTYPLAGHDNYAEKCFVEWQQNVISFLDTN